MYRLFPSKYSKHKRSIKMLSESESESSRNPGLIELHFIYLQLFILEQS